MFEDETVNEELREKLLKEEAEMRATQPERWTKTKYRKYGDMMSKRHKEKEKALTIKA